MNKLELEEGEAKRVLARVTMRMILIVQETAKHHGRFDGWVEGSQVVISSSAQPFLDAAHELINRGFGPATILIMRHKGSGTNSLRGPIGKAAMLETETGREERDFVIWEQTRCLRARF